MRVAVNGFGRIGRLVLRALEESNKKYDFDIVAVNDLQDINTSIHLFKYDSAHGRFCGNVCKISDSEFLVNDKKLMHFSERNADRLPWNELGVDLVLECTGALKTRDFCNLHLKAGAKKVLISCPSGDVDSTIVYGVNHDCLGKNDIVVSNASCTTNCLAHVVKAVHSEIKILNGFATTIHSFTGDQRLVDTGHGDLRRARSAASAMIPTSTGATEAIEKIFPELRGKLSGLSVRVPTLNVSVVDFTFTASRAITADDINRSVEKYAAGQPKNVFGYTREPLVSIDFNHSPHSAVVDLSLTKVVDNTVGHIVAWYDNEWGFSNRMLDTAQEMIVNIA
ncbi:MAG: type I glyceraldehyde-3-phosphate dehydrogenase [Holosporaceae bacterium]|jgi:glyceraldehyde 3-phosphate dehydrogenase|nr:type I glyceraldehyde-3-phosphate dehydrogenase [Holosporaceae bacterium]